MLPTGISFQKWMKGNCSSVGLFESVERQDQSSLVLALIGLVRDYACELRIYDDRVPIHDAHATFFAPEKNAARLSWVFGAKQETELCTRLAPRGGDMG